MQYREYDLYANGNRMQTKMHIASCLDEVRTFMQWLLEILSKHEFAANDVFAIQLAVEEALVNAITHGNKMDQTKQVCMVVALGPKGFRIRIRDEGDGFRCTRESDEPFVEVSSICRCGRGLLLIRHYMDEVLYNRKGNGVMLFRRRSSVK